MTKEDTIPETALEIEDLEIEREIVNIDFEIGDNVVYPHHGAGQVVKKEEKNILGEVREYLTIKILHNDMTVMVPCSNAGKAGLRRVIDEDTVKKVLAVLADDVSEMPKNWNRRFKHNRDKIKTGDIYELAEVVRNLAVREQDKGLSTGEKQMYTRAKKILASEMMYALEKTEDEAEAYLDEILLRTAEQLAGAAQRRRCSPPPTPIIGLTGPDPDTRHAVRRGPSHCWWPRAAARASGAASRRPSSRSPGGRCSSGRWTRCARPGSRRSWSRCPTGVDGARRVRRRARRRDALGVRARGAGRRAGPGPRRGARRRASAGRARRCSRACVAALEHADCAIAAARVDRHGQGGRRRGAVVATLDRSRLWAVQTPQAFRREALRGGAGRRRGDPRRATDDAWLVERAGGTVRVVESSPANFKVTTPHDLRVADPAAA